jgi:hypothetical protein
LRAPGPGRLPLGAEPVGMRTRMSTVRVAGVGFGAGGGDGFGAGPFPMPRTVADRRRGSPAKYLPDIANGP